MNVKRVVNGFLEENCYIVTNDKDECLVIDPGSEGERIIDFIKMSGSKVLGILVTHYHFDHIGALEQLMSAFEIDKVIDYKSEGKCALGDFEFEVILNFGHTLDSASFYFEKEKVIFTGDFIFKDTIGNYNKEDEEEMIRSLKAFVNMPGDIIIYPGHGKSTSTTYEVNNNPYLRGLL